ncbi:MAG: ribosome maturation factor RimM [Vicinamibacterales bacterium]
MVVNPHTDFAEERFRPGAELHVRLTDGSRRVAGVTSSRFHRGRPIIGLTGVDSLDDAERYAGAELRIPESAQGALPPGQYYHHQLMGCEVVTEAGDPVGRVIGVEGGTGQSRIVVGGAGRRHEIPMAGDICTVDVDQRRIVIRPPEGLLDL